MDNCRFIGFYSSIFCSAQEKPTYNLNTPIFSHQSLLCMPPLFYHIKTSLGLKSKTEENLNRSKLVDVVEIWIMEIYYIKDIFSLTLCVIWFRGCITVRILVGISLRRMLNQSLIPLDVFVGIFKLNPLSVLCLLPCL